MWPDSHLPPQSRAAGGIDSMPMQGSPGRMTYRAKTGLLPLPAAAWNGGLWPASVARQPRIRALTVLAGAFLAVLLVQGTVAQLVRGEAVERARQALDAGEQSIGLQLHRWQTALDLLADMPEASGDTVTPAVRSAAGLLAQDAAAVLEIRDTSRPEAPPVLTTGPHGMVLAGEAADLLDDTIRRSTRSMAAVVSPALISQSDGRRWVVMVRIGPGPQGSFRRFQLLIPQQNLSRMAEAVVAPAGVHLALTDQLGQSLGSRQTLAATPPPRLAVLLADLTGHPGRFQVTEPMVGLPEWSLVALSDPPGGFVRAMLNPLLPGVMTLIAATLILSFPTRRAPPPPPVAERPTADDLRLRETRHELRTLTFSALLQAEALICAAPEAGRQCESLSAILVALQAMLSLEDQLTGATPQVARFDPAVLLRRVLALIGPMATSAKVTLEEDIRWTSGEVTGPRDALVQMAMNLLMNAIKYAPGSPLKLELAEDWRAQGQLWLSLKVSDKGPGVARRLQRRLFLSGFRAATHALGAPEGEGLGLSIVQRLVQAAGGSVRVSSRVGRGTTFTIDLPVTPAAPSQADLRLDGLRVMVVDDTAAVRQWLADRLRQAGATVTTTDTLQAAVALARAHAFDAAVLDITLGGASGLDLARSLRDLPQPPVLLAYSADVDARQRRACLAAGFASVHLKGSDPTPLLRALLAVPRSHDDPTGATVIPLALKA